MFEPLLASIGPLGAGAVVLAIAAGALAMVCAETARYGLRSG